MRHLLESFLVYRILHQHWGKHPQCSKARFDFKVFSLPRKMPWERSEYQCQGMKTKQLGRTPPGRASLPPPVLSFMHPQIAAPPSVDYKSLRSHFKQLSLKPDIRWVLLTTGFHTPSGKTSLPTEFSINNTSTAPNIKNQYPFMN